MAELVGCVKAQTEAGPLHGTVDGGWAVVDPTVFEEIKTVRKISHIAQASTGVMPSTLPLPLCAALWCNADSH